MLKDIFAVDLKQTEEMGFKSNVPVQEKNITAGGETLYTNFSTDPNTFGVLIESLISSKYEEIIVENNLIRSAHIAGIVMSNEELPSQTYVVSLASGSKCNSFRKFDGTLVYDCHAVTLARRGLLLFLYQQLQLLADPLKESISIFYRHLDDPKRCSLRDHFKFHLFVSSTPPGDASCDPYDDNVKGLRVYANDGIRTMSTLVFRKEREKSVH